MRLGELLEGCVATMRRSLRATLGIGLVLALLAGAVQLLAQGILAGAGLATTPELPDPTASLTPEQVRELLVVTGPLFLAAGLAAVAGLLLQTLASGLLAHLTAAAVRGRAVDPGQEWERTRSRLPALLALSLLVTAVLLAVVVLPILPGLRLLADDPETAVASMVLGVLCATPVALFLWPRLMLAPVVLILEGATVGSAVQRGWRIVRGRSWRALGIGLTVVLLGQVIATVVQFPFALGGLTTSPEAGPSTMAVFTSTLGVIAGSAVSLPFVGIGMILLYTDLRLRSEAGFAERLQEQ